MSSKETIHMDLK